MERRERKHANTLEHIRIRANICEHLRTLKDTCEHLRSHTNTYEHTHKRSRTQNTHEHTRTYADTRGHTWKIHTIDSHRCETVKSCENGIKLVHDLVNMKTLHNVMACKHKKYVKLTKSWLWKAEKLWNGTKLAQRLSQIWKTSQRYGMSTLNIRDIDKVITVKRWKVVKWYNVGTPT